MTDEKIQELFGKGCDELDKDQHLKYSIIVNLDETMKKLKNLEKILTDEQMDRCYDIIQELAIIMKKKYEGGFPFNELEYIAEKIKFSNYSSLVCTVGDKVEHKEIRTVNLRNVN